MSSDLPNTLVMEAPAKLNLFLRVLGPRDDGFHEIETAIVPLGLADRLHVHAFSDLARFRTLSLALEVTGDEHLVRGVPVDESNLALRAAAALAERTAPRGFAELTLEKRIPVAAGLGGGSSDAAATLTALNRLWKCGLSQTELLGIAAEVGSDVPALMLGGPALARGRGEIVEPIAVPPLRWGLIPQPFGVRTSDAFGWWDDDGGPTGPDPRSSIQALAGGDPPSIPSILHNDLEESVARRHPEVAEARLRLLEGGAVATVMCGSGPTVAGLLPAEGDWELSGALEVWSG